MTNVSRGFFPSILECSRKSNAKLLLLIFLAFLVSFMVSFKSVAEEDTSQTIVDFVEESFKDWGSSKFLTLIGLEGGQDTQQADLEKIVSKLSSISNILKKEQVELDEISGQFKQLFSQVTNEEKRLYQYRQQNIEIHINGWWAAYTNIMNGQKNIDDIAGAASDRLLNQVENGAFLQDLGDNVSELANLQSAGNFFNIVESFKRKLNSQLTTQFSSSDKKFSDILDGYNESLMRLLYKNIVMLQKAYVIENTYLYLFYNDERFKNISFSQSGVGLSADSYSENVLKLNAYYQAKINELTQFVVENFVSDTSEIIQKKYPDVTTTKAKSYSFQNDAGATESVIGGSWIDHCKLYSWSGVSNKAFSGDYNQASILMYCQGSETIFEYKSSCIGNGGLTVFFGETTYGDSSVNVQCPLFSKTAFSLNSQLGLTTSSIGPFSFGKSDSNAPLVFASNIGFTYIDDADNANLSITTPQLVADASYFDAHTHEGEGGKTDGIFFVNTALEVQESEYLNGAFTIPLTVWSDDSLISQIIIDGTVSAELFNYHWDITLRCSEAYFCRLYQDPKALCFSNGTTMYLSEGSEDEVVINFEESGCNF